MRLDLHMHTTASDGAWSPDEVVRGAVAGGLDVISITDHDTAAGVAPAQEAASELRIQVIPGIEVSSTFQRQDIHILGYFVDPHSAAIRGHSARAGSRREERMREMLALLEEEGIHVSFAEVEEAAGPDRVVIGRPHLAQALVAGGHVASIYEAFDHLIGDDSPAFVPTHLLEPAEAVGVVVEGGGIPIWAHPPGELVDTLLPGLLDAGLRGLEVYRPRNRRSEVTRLESICKSAGLLMTGGSDWHSPDGGSALGDFHVDSGEIEWFL
ncbi:MAG: PHP domain-containing protein, partial [Longimicrobiales bacterium]|nr:PHP domain-containing protein [Longimicrobiales bacterium]